MGLVGFLSKRFLLHGIWLVNCFLLEFPWVYAYKKISSAVCSALELVLQMWPTTLLGGGGHRIYNIRSYLVHTGARIRVGYRCAIESTVGKFICLGQYIRSQTLPSTIAILRIVCHFQYHNSYNLHIFPTFSLSSFFQSIKQTEQTRMHTFTTIAVLGLAAAVSAYTLSPELVSALEARDLDVEDYLFARALVARGRGGRSSSGSRSPPPSSNNSPPPPSRLYSPPPPQPQVQQSGGGSVVDRLERATNGVNAVTGLASAGQDAYSTFRGRSEIENYEDAELFVRSEFNFDEYDY